MTARRSKLLLAVVVVVACKGSNDAPKPAEDVVAKTAKSVDAAVRPGPDGTIALAGGKFTMGSGGVEVSAARGACAKDPRCDRATFANEQPAHEATVEPFHLDAREITVAEYIDWINSGTIDIYDDRVERNGVTVIGKTEYHDVVDRHLVARPAVAHRPVWGVTFENARAYCRDRAGDLPTEAQWEFAARGTEVRRYPWGSKEPTCDDVVYGRMPGGPCAAKNAGPQDVASAPGDVTPEGVHDLGGNLAELTRDPYKPYGAGGPAGSGMVVRGGSFADVPPSLRAAVRGTLAVDETADTVGFRCAFP